MAAAFIHRLCFRVVVADDPQLEQEEQDAAQRQQFKRRLQRWLRLTPEERERIRRIIRKRRGK